MARPKKQLEYAVGHTYVHRYHILTYIHTYVHRVVVVLDEEASGMNRETHERLQTTVGISHDHGRYTAYTKNTDMRPCKHT